MYEYKNGDVCPCCGAIIDGKNKRWLKLFSLYCDEMGLNDNPHSVPTIQDIDRPIPPPDVGIYPPVKPRHEIK